MKVLEQFADQAGEVLTGGHTADWAGKNVIEHQGGDAELRECAAQSAFHGAIDAAAHEHAAAFDVHRAHGIRKNHDGQNEPRCGFADVAFGFAAGVIGGGSEVIQNDSCGTPEGNKSKEGCGGNNDTGNSRAPAARSSGGVRNRTHEWVSMTCRLKSSHFFGAKSSRAGCN